MKTPSRWKCSAPSPACRSGILRNAWVNELPNKSGGRWRAGAITAAFSVVDGIVRGTEKAEFAKGAIPLRPIELLLNGESAGGWAEIEKMRCSGVRSEEHTSELQSLR